MNGKYYIHHMLRFGADCWPRFLRHSTIDRYNATFFYRFLFASTLYHRNIYRYEISRNSDKAVRIQDGAQQMEIYLKGRISLFERTIFWRIHEIHRECSPRRQASERMNSTFQHELAYCGIADQPKQRSRMYCCSLDSSTPAVITFQIANLIFWKFSYPSNEPMETRDRDEHLPLLHVRYCGVIEPVQFIFLSFSTEDREMKWMLPNNMKHRGSISS